ncbi:Ketol-acid reductoisomerase [Serratia fonticola]|uniref:Ketol-acid reductoisomerase (NADP(+)) n=1 Tax=Serratia fonticola TaxID=47917 RepID=A0A4U9U359_SERFO|nr:Ketol-acid reductoisomerase [Serratia fonticola]
MRYAAGGSLLCFDKLVSEGTDPAYAEKLIQFGWETITEALKQGGITLMMDRLSNPAKLRAYALSEQLKGIMAPLFQKHMDDIISGEFSQRYDGRLGRRRCETADLA